MKSITRLSLILSICFLIAPFVVSSHAKPEEKQMKVEYGSLSDRTTNSIDSEQLGEKLAFSWGHYFGRHKCERTSYWGYNWSYCKNYREERAENARNSWRQRAYNRATHYCKRPFSGGSIGYAVCLKNVCKRYPSFKEDCETKLAAAEQAAEQAKKAEADRRAAEQAKKAEAAAKAEADRLAVEKAKVGGIPVDAPVLGAPADVSVLGTPGAGAAELRGVDYGCGNPIINSHETCLNNWNKKPWQHCLDWARGKANPQDQEFERTKCQCQHGEGMKWTDAGSGANTGLFKDNCVQWSGETVYLDDINVAENDVSADAGRRDLRECTPIMNKYDPYGTFVCFNETKCKEKGYTWMDFNTAGHSGFLGCSIESPSTIVTRAKVTLTEFSGNREACSRESAWQAHCVSRLDGTPTDLAPCFALKDSPDNFDELTPRQLGVLQENSYQCQTAMPLCEFKSEGVLQSIKNNDKRDEFLKKAAYRYADAVKLGDVGSAASIYVSISQGDYEDALGVFADMASNNAFSCVRSSISAVTSKSPTMQGALDASQSCLNFATLGLSDVVIAGVNVLGALLGRNPKCQFNSDVSSSGDSLSNEKIGDFGDWGMYPRSVRLECGISEEECDLREGWTPCNMGGKSCKERSESALAILRCEKRHGEGVDCHEHGRHGKETKAAEERCLNLDVSDVDLCPVDEEILYGKEVKEESLYTWWPLQEGAEHPWANKVGACKSYDADGYCEGHDKCAQNPWDMSRSQREECQNADSMVGLRKAYQNIDGNTDRCDSQPGIQPMGC